MHLFYVSSGVSKSTMSMEGSNVNSNKGDAYQDKDLTIRISNHGQSIQSFIVLGGRYNIFSKKKTECI